jgi:hypothetical protein
MEPEELPDIVVFDAQDDTYYNLADFARDRSVGSRRMTLEVLEAPAMERTRYMFAQ